MSKQSLIYKKIDSEFIEEVVHKINMNKRVHRRFVGQGLLHIDRQLPFLCVYRLGETPDLNSAKLLKGEASYFIIPAEISGQRVSLLLNKIIQALSDIYGAFLLVEIWPQNDKQKFESKNSLKPEINIVADTTGDLISTCERFANALNKIKIHRHKAKVLMQYSRNTRPSRKKPLLKKIDLVALNCYSIGISLKPVYNDEKTGDFFPLIFRKFHSEFSHALKHLFFEFTQSMAQRNPKHYYALGPKSVTNLMYKVDKELANLSSMIDFLLWVTPTNIDKSWNRFRKNTFGKPPIFQYPPLPIDPAKLKEQLYSIEIQKIHDPTIQHLFSEKRSELDRMLTMIYERSTSNFVLSSMQLYGRVDENLYNLAIDILNHFDEATSDDTFTGKHAAEDFAKIAQQEIESLKAHYNFSLTPRVILTDNVTGLIVNNGDLYVGRSVKVPKNRLDALIQHEVGTHVVTFINGSYQPLKLFSFGLPGYDETQEGLAVLAEYLVGQLSIARVRLLAARVIAAKYLEMDKSFVETFYLLNKEYAFEAKTAYRITSRIYRGGGLTKDAVYLRGFNNIIKYLQEGGDLEMLYLGKYALAHTPFVQELLYREVLEPPVVLPRFLLNKRSNKRLLSIKKGKTLIELLELCKND